MITYIQLLCFQNILKKLNNKNLICVSPDVGGVARTRDLANRIKADLAIIDKRRPAPGKSEVMNILGNVKGKTCIIVDDIIDSGGTIINAVDALKKNGAVDVYVFITHGVLSGETQIKFLLFNFFLIYFENKGAVYKLSTGISKKPCI